MLATQHSMENSLRWTRRLIVMILMIANLMAVLLADTAATVMKQHGATMRDSSMQADISDLAARFISLETGDNAPEFRVTAR